MPSSQRGFFTMPGGMGATGRPGGGLPPPPYSASLALHFDAFDLSTLTLDGSNLDSWRCKVTGNQWSNTGANRPLVNSGTMSPRGVVFGRVGSDNKWLTGTAVNVAVPITVFKVVNFQVTSGSHILALYNGTATNFASAGTGFLATYLAGSVTTYTQVRGSTTGTYAASSALGSTGLMTVGFRVGSTALSSAYTDMNRSDVTGTRAGSDMPSSFTFSTLGSTDSTFFSRGTVGEVLVYAAALDSTQRTNVYNYLTAKWGTT